MNNLERYLNDCEKELLKRPVNLVSIFEHEESCAFAILSEEGDMEAEDLVMFLLARASEVTAAHYSEGGKFDLINGDDLGAVKEVFGLMVDDVMEKINKERAIQ